MAQQKKSRIYGVLYYFSKHCFIAFIRSDNNLRIFLNYLFNFSKPSSACKGYEVLLRSVNFTGYHLIRRTMLTSAISCLFVSFWNDSGLFWDLISLFFGNSLEKLMKVETVCYIKPKLIVNTLVPWPS